MRVATSWFTRSPWVIVCVTALSLYASWMAGKEVSSLISAVRTEVAEKGVGVTLSKTPVSLPELTAMSVMFTQLIPNVTFKVDGKLLKVSVESPANYADWVMAVSTLQTYQKGLVWDVKVICTTCEGQGAYAEVEPYLQKIVWK